MFDTGDEDPNEMKSDEHDRKISRRLMNISYPFDTPIGICGHHDACRRGRGEHEHEGDDHGPARRVMTEIAPRTKMDGIGKKTEDWSKDNT